MPPCLHVEFRNVSACVLRRALALISFQGSVETTVEMHSFTPCSRDWCLRMGLGNIQALFSLSRGSAYQGWGQRWSPVRMYGFRESDARSSPIPTAHRLARMAAPGPFRSITMRFLPHNDTFRLQKVHAFTPIRLVCQIICRHDRTAQNTRTEGSLARE